MDKKRRVIAFMNAYSHGKSGGDMVFIEIAKRLKAFDFSVVTSELGKKLCETSGLSANFHITSTEKEFKNIILIYLKRTFKAVFMKLSVQPHDILLGTSDFLPDVLPLFFLKKRHPQNQWFQHIFHLIPKERKIPFYSQRISLFFIKKYADKIIVDNSLLKDELKNLGFDAKKIIVNHPGIDHDILRKIKSDHHRRYEGVFMAQLRPSKGIGDLIKIWKLVCNKIPAARLAIIGKGSKENMTTLKSRIREQSLNKNIDVLGYQGDTEAFTIIKSSSIFLSPSHEEGFGIAAVQAQALGVPIVAWNLSVFEEIFPQGMSRIQKGDHAAFAQETIQLLTKNSLHETLSRQALNNASLYNWDATADREVTLFT